MADPALIKRLQELDAQRSAPRVDAALLERLRAADTVAATPQGPTQADAEAEYPLPGADGNLRRAGIKTDVRAYMASPEGRAEAAQDSRNNMRQVAKGVTLGAAPRIEAAVRTGFGYAGDYGKTLDDIRGQNEAYEKEKPGYAMIARGVGDVATGRAVAPIFRGAYNVAAPYVGERVAQLAALLSTGGVAGGVTGANESHDLTKPGEVVGDAAKGAVTGAGGALALGAAPMVARGVATATSKVAQGVSDAVGRVTNTGAASWADRKREKLLADWLDSQGISGRGPVTQGASAEQRAVDAVANQFERPDRAISAVNNNPAPAAPVSYYLNDAYGPTLTHALKTPRGETIGMRQSAENMIAGQGDHTRRELGVIGQTFQHKELLHNRAGRYMTPEYERLGPQQVDAPEVAALVRRDPGVANLLPPSVSAAVTEGRLPHGDMRASLNIGAPRDLTAVQIAENQFAALQGLPPVHATHHPTETTWGVIENMTRRSTGRVNPENKTDIVTDAAASRNLQAALRRDAQNDPVLQQGIDLKRRHAEHKNNEEAYERGQRVLKTEGAQRHDDLIELRNETSPTARRTAELGMRGHISDSVDGLPADTVRNAGNLVGSEAQRQAMAIVLSQQPRGAYRRGANQIADHLTEVGRRAEHSRSIQSVIESGKVPEISGGEIMARAGITAKMTPGLMPARVAQFMSGMNRTRATEMARMLSQPVNGTQSTQQQAYEQIAREIIAKQLAGRAPSALTQPLGAIGALEGADYAVGR